MKHHFFLTALVFVPTTAFAEDVCDGFLNTPRTSLVSSDTQKLGVECMMTVITQAQQRVADLEAQNKLLQQNVNEQIEREVEAALLKQSIPTGAVMAFDSIRGCPISGWEEFDAAAGRMIVGIDGDTYELPYKAGVPDYQQGGSPTHKLSEAELPIHHHFVGWSSGGKIHSVSLNGTKIDVPDDHQFQLPSVKEGGQANRSLTTTNVGSGKEHNNMPPYVALYYCIKTD